MNKEIEFVKVDEKEEETFSQVGVFVLKRDFERKLRFIYMLQTLFIIDLLIIGFALWMIILEVF